MARSITLIPVVPKNEVTESNGIIHPIKKRVAAYCRVSTDQDQQLNSFEAQRIYFKNLINNNDEWKIVGIYADEGISGTNTKKRK